MVCSGDAAGAFVGATVGIGASVTVGAGENVGDGPPGFRAFGFRCGQERVEHAIAAREIRRQRAVDEDDRRAD